MKFKFKVTVNIISDLKNIGACTLSQTRVFIVVRTPSWLESWSLSKINISSALFFLDILLCLLVMSVPLRVFSILIWLDRLRMEAVSYAYNTPTDVLSKTSFYLIIYPIISNSADTGILYSDLLTAAIQLSTFIPSSWWPLRRSHLGDSGTIQR